MRVSILGALVLWLGGAALQTAVHAAPAQCPGIVEDGGALRVPLDGVSQRCAGSGCPTGSGSAVEEIIVQLCNLGAGLPIECGRCECCRDESPDLMTGSTAVPLGGNPQDFCGIGGRGQAIGEAGLCLLRDLAQPARAPSNGGPGIQIDHPLPFGGKALSVTQRIGFRDFDPVLRRMRGYHSVSVCAPVLGCVNDLVQPFSAQLRRVVDGVAACDDYLLQQPWLLEIETEELEHNLGVGLGPFSVYTPVGEISITPRFNYEANLEVAQTPWADGNDTTVRVEGDWFRSQLFDVTKVADGILALSKAAGDTGTGFGWNAALGLGSRDADTSGSVWMPPNGDFPDRPDFDLTIARKKIEKRPATRFVTGVEVTYGLDQLVGFLKIPPFSLDRAAVFLNSNLGVAFASQFAIAFDEGRSDVILDCTGRDARTKVRLDSAVDAYGELTVEAGIDLDFVLDLGFFEKHFRFHPKVNVIPPIESGPDLLLGPSARASINVALAPQGPAAYGEFISFSGGVEDGRAFVDACLGSPPPPPQEVPTPTIEPGDQTELIDELRFPCNVCMYFPKEVTEACLPRQDLVNAGTIPPDYVCDLSINGLPCIDPNCQNVEIDPPAAVNVREVLFPVPQASLPMSQQWVCDAFEKFGCFDLCDYDPTAAQPLTLVSSAVENIGTRCRDATGGSDGSPAGQSCFSDVVCDDRNPCTTDECVFSGEFGNCKITASNGPCDDGLFCNGTDSCVLGVCGAHAGNPCIVNGNCCDESENQCPAACPSTPCEGSNAGDTCDDRSSCTVGDRCVGTLAGLQCEGQVAIACTTDSICDANGCDGSGQTPQCVMRASGACPPGCGDGVLGAGEDCDGADDATCPGQCDGDCRCAPPGRDRGEECTDPGQCASGFCADGTCCDRACDDAVERCDLPGRVGTCTAVAAQAPTLDPRALAIALAVLVLAGAVGLMRAGGPH